MVYLPSKNSMKLLAFLIGNCTPAYQTHSSIWPQQEWLRPLRYYKPPFKFRIHWKHRSNTTSIPKYFRQYQEYEKEEMGNTIYLISFLSIYKYRCGHWIFKHFIPYSERVYQLTRTTLLHLPISQCTDDEEEFADDIRVYNWDNNVQRIRIIFHIFQEIGYTGCDG